MAKQGQKTEAARQELVGELTELRSANLKADGTPKADAVPQELVRIKEIEGKLEIAPNAGPDTKPAAPAPSPEPPKNETDAQKAKRLERENKELRDKAARGRDAQKIKSAPGQQKIGYRKRPDEIMDTALADAEDRDPAKWDDSNRLAVERTIRKFVRKGGSRKDHKGTFYEIPAGFRKGLTFEQKVYALGLLEKLGRLKETAEKIANMIQSREKKMTISQQRQSNKEFNTKLEGLGVSWDDSIQVPGFSDTLR